MNYNYEFNVTIIELLITSTTISGMISPKPAWDTENFRLVTYIIKY